MQTHEHAVCPYVRVCKQQTNSIYGTVSDQHLCLLYVLATTTMVHDLKAINIGSNLVDYAKPQSVQLHSQGAYLPIRNYL